MRYLGLDVHGAATVYCLLGAAGAIVERGSVATTSLHSRSSRVGYRATRS
jgi:opacity protein-like surface antigen